MAPDLASPEPISPVLGRDSPAAAQPARLRAVATAATASYRADGGDTPDWSVRAATVTGVRHRLAGEEAQDAFAWRTVATAEVSADGGRPDRLVVAVADGVGTVPGSAAAAAAAVVAACEAAGGVDPPPRLAGSAGAASGPAAAARSAAPLAGSAHPAGVVFARASQAVRRAGGATTLVVVSLEVVSGQGSGWAARIGDSTAMVLRGGGWRDLWPEVDGDDRTVSTVTAALPGDSQVEIVDLTVPPGQALVLLSDGVAGPLRDGPTTVAPALAEGLTRPPHPLALAALTDFARQGCFDDRTILGVWLRAR